MNFVFISPNFPEAYRWFCIRLRDILPGVGAQAQDAVQGVDRQPVAVAGPDGGLGPRVAVGLPDWFSRLKKRGIRNRMEIEVLHFHCPGLEDGGRFPLRSWQIQSGSPLCWW